MNSGSGRAGAQHAAPLRFGVLRRMSAWVVAAVVLAGGTGVLAAVKQSEATEAARRAYESSDYTKAVMELQGAAAKEPQNGGKNG